MKASILRRALKNEIVRMCKGGELHPQRGKGVMTIAFKMAGLSDAPTDGKKSSFVAPQVAMAAAKQNEPKDMDSAKQALRNAAMSLKRYDPVVAEADDPEEVPPEKDKKEKPITKKPEPKIQGAETPAPDDQGGEEKPSTGKDPFAAKNGEESGEEAPPDGAEEKPEAPEEPEEPKEPEDPEQVPATEDPEEKPLGKEEAKAIIKTLLAAGAQRNPQTIQRLAKQIEISPKRIEDFVYALATKYVQLHVIRQKEQ